MTFVPSLVQYGRHAAAGAALDSDAVAWAAAVFAADGTVVSGPRLTLVSNLITALKAAGVWTLLNRLWLLASQNPTAALIDLVARANASLINAPGFTADQGYVFPTNTQAVDTNFNTSSGGAPWGQNSASAFLWTADYSALGDTVMLYNDFVSTTYIETVGTGGALFASHNSTDGTFLAGTATTQGLRAYSLTSSSGYKAYKDASPIETVTATSATPANRTIKIGNALGIGAGFNCRVYAAGIGGGLSDTQVSALYGALHTYLQSVAGLP